MAVTIDSIAKKATIFVNDGMGVKNGSEPDPLDVSFDLPLKPYTLHFPLVHRI